MAISVIALLTRSARKQHCRARSNGIVDIANAKQAVIDFSKKSVSLFERDTGAGAIQIRIQRARAVLSYTHYSVTCASYYIKTP